MCSSDLGIAVSTIQYTGGQAGWLTATVNGTSATATQTASVQLSAAVAGLAPGLYTAVVPITATGAPNSPQNINVTFTVTPRPTLELSRTTVAISAISGAANPAAETVNLTSSTSAPAAGLAATIAYNEPAQAGWLTATVNPNTTPSTLTLQASAGARPAGTYTATVTVASTDASNAPRQVTVTFTVVPAPRIDVNQPTLSFGAPVGAANPTAQTIQITNGGGGTLTGLTATAVYTNGAGWLNITLTPGTNAGSVLVQPNITGLAAGTYAANVRLTATGASNTPQNVGVTLIISSQPTIAVSPVTLPFTSTGAAPTAQVVTITNTGGGTLTGLNASVQYTNGSGWLNFTLNAGGTPPTLSVQPNPTGLAAGTYNATLNITATGASNSVAIPVSFTISTPPSIVLSRSSVTFGAVIGEGDPLAEAVTITNGGGGSLTGLAANISYTIVGQSWLSTTLSTAGGTSTLTLSAARGTLPVGSYTATVNVTSGVASNSPRPISVTFNVTQPSMTVGNAAPSFTQASGGGDAAALLIPINGVGGQVTGLARSIINYTGPVPNNTWLTATLNGNASPASITLTANAGTAGAPRTPGVYTATVRLTSTNASNSPVDINVTFTVEVSLANNLFNQVYTDYCSNCHFSGGSYPNLSTPALFRSNMLNVVPTSNTTTYPLAATYNRVIVAGNASQSYLMYMLNKAVGARPMPISGASTVPQPLRDLMATWINQGAKNN